MLVCVCICRVLQRKCESLEKRNKELEEALTGAATGVPAGTVPVTGAGSNAMDVH